MVVKAGHIPDTHEGFDIGPETIAKYADVIKSSKTVVWNGPMGVFEMPPFDKEPARWRMPSSPAARSASSAAGQCRRHSGVRPCRQGDPRQHRGGASLEMLEGKKFAAVELLDDK